MAIAIRTESLTKYYGSTRGVEDLDLEVETGEVFGFIGPNGAGKSTTIRVLLDLIRPTSGRASILGLDARSDSVEVKRRVGYLPGELALYDAMTGEELLGFVTALRGEGAGGDRSAVLAERLELDLSRKVKAYSSGNRQKLGLVQALMHDPELLLLDEPTSALDPLVQQEFYRIVDEVRAEGRTVFLSSHVLPEVERIADRVGIIRNGTLVAVESVASLKNRAVRRIEILFATPLDSDPFTGLESVRSSHLHDQGRVAEVLVEGEVDEVLKTAARWRVTNLISHEGDLEEAFLAYYQEPGDDAP